MKVCRGLVGILTLTDGVCGRRRTNTTRQRARRTSGAESKRAARTRLTEAEDRVTQIHIQMQMQVHTD